MIKHVLRKDQNIHNKNNSLIRLEKCNERPKCQQMNTYRDTNFVWAQVLYICQALANMHIIMCAAVHFWYFLLTYITLLLHRSPGEVSWAREISKSRNAPPKRYLHFIIKVFSQVFTKLEIVGTTL